jgi:hypothetical protein
MKLAVISLMFAAAAPPIELQRIPSPIIFRGDPKIAYRAVVADSKVFEPAATADEVLTCRGGGREVHNPEAAPRSIESAAKYGAVVFSRSAAPSCGSIAALPTTSTATWNSSAFGPSHLQMRSCSV